MGNVKEKRAFYEYVRYAYRLFLGLLFRRHVQKCGKMFRVCGKVHRSELKNTNLVIGNHVLLHAGVGFYLDAPGATVEIGDKTFINRRTEFMCKQHIRVGSHCAISWDVSIMDTDYHTIMDGRPNTKPVIIGDHVWIGCKATILKGVTIGDGAIVAAGSVVAHDVPPRSVVAGVPAKVVKTDVDWHL
ncbi:acyltransferase [Paenibacillus elgii]|nr:acyltransferase [Paenibacillus elgii]MCM3268303.1 acyltransferase [Paenibacillus elgii]